MQTLHVPLLWFAAALVAVSASTRTQQQQQPSTPWAVDTFVSLEESDGELIYAELRHHCCQSPEDTAASFCDEFTVPQHDCVRLEQYLRQASNESAVQCDCGLTNGELTATPPGRKLKTLKLRVDHTDENRTELVKMAVFQGDFKVVDARVDAMCERFKVDDAACGKLRAVLREQVNMLEVNETKHGLLKHEEISTHAVEQAFETVSSIVKTLLGRERELRRRLEEKAAAIVKLHLQSKGERHNLERRVRELENALLIKQQEERTATDLNQYEGVGLAVDALAESREAATSPLFAPISRRIPRVDVNNFTYAEYLEYARTSTPVIIRGLHLQPGSPGLPYWPLSQLNKTCGDAIVTLKRAVTESSASTGSVSSTKMWAGIQAVTRRPLRDFLQDFTSDNQSRKAWPAGVADLYLHDASIRKFCPQLLSEFTIPRYFVNDQLQKLSRSKQRDYWPSLFIGDRRTASALHADWASTAAWMGLLAGRKHWAIAKPSARAALHEILPTDEAPTQGRFKASLLDRRLTDLLRPGELYEDVLEAGEVLFIPADCPHQVQNLDKTIAVATNYVDAANIKAFLRHLRTGRDISSEGYDDHVRMLREVASISPFDPSTEPRDLSFTAFKARFA